MTQLDTAATGVTSAAAIPAAQRASVYKRLNHAHQQPTLPTHRSSSVVAHHHAVDPIDRRSGISTESGSHQQRPSHDIGLTPSASATISTGWTPFLEAAASHNSTFEPMQLPPTMTAVDFQHAVQAVAVNAMQSEHNRRSSQPHTAQHHPSYAKIPVQEALAYDTGEGGHDAPAWTRETSASVLLACTFLYAIIAGSCPLPLSSSLHTR